MGNVGRDRRSSGKLRGAPVARYRLVFPGREWLAGQLFDGQGAIRRSYGTNLPLDDFKVLDRDLKLLARYLHQLLARPFSRLFDGRTYGVEDLATAADAGKRSRCRVRILHLDSLRRQPKRFRRNDGKTRLGSAHVDGARYHGERAVGIKPAVGRSRLSSARPVRDRHPNP